MTDPATPASSSGGVRDEGSPGATDLEIVARQLGRPPRGVLAIAYRTPDGQPAVVKTAPRLADGTPFPTLYYLTDPRLTGEASRQEAIGSMRGMTERLGTDPELAAAYRVAHESFLAERDEIESLGTDFSGGGMPERVKCLHVLMAHALAKGPGLNPLGDEAVAVAAETGLRGTAIPGDWPAYDRYRPDAGADGRPANHRSNDE